jgi:hypothetical protein
MESSNVYKIVPSHGNLKDYVIEYRSKFYDKYKNKIIPLEILNGSRNMKKQFLDGYYDADGCRNDTKNCGCHRMDTKGHISAMNLYFLLCSLGYNVSLNKRIDKMEIYRLTFSYNSFRKNKDAIKKITLIGETTDYVYDLETTVGHFHAGVGRMIVKNTDSVFFINNIRDKDGIIQKDKNALEMSIKLGMVGSDAFCSYLPGVMNMGYEKVLWPFAIISKKRYVGNLYETDPNKCYQKSMGIVLKRRDNAPIVKIVCGGIIDQIINKRSPEGAVEFTKKVLHDIFSGKYPIDKFIISKTLKGNYKNRSQISHAVLADRIAERDPGNAPMSNDRIQYVYKITKEEDVITQGDRIETPEFILQNKIPIDYLFYITNQIMLPCIQFLDLIIEEADELFNQYIIREQNRRLGKKTMKYYTENAINNTDGLLNIDDDNIFNSTITIIPKPKLRAKPKIKNKSLAIIDDKPCFSMED